MMVIGTRDDGSDYKRRSVKPGPVGSVLRFDEGDIDNPYWFNPETGAKQPVEDF